MTFPELHIWFEVTVRVAAIGGPMVVAAFALDHGMKRPVRPRAARRSI